MKLVKILGGVVVGVVLVDAAERVLGFAVATLEDVPHRALGEDDETGEHDQGQDDETTHGDLVGE